MEPVKSRAYTSPVRDEAARRTRSAVVAAALELFREQGYPATTIDQIAARAEVSRPTVFGVGSKAQLLRLARDRAIAGDDDPHPIMARQPFTALAAADSPAAVLHAYAPQAAAINRRFADLNEVLHQAQAHDPQLRELWRTSEQERLVGAQAVVDLAATKGPLDPRLDPGTAAQVLWLLTAPEQYRRLVHDQGWTHERYVAWLAEAAVRLLLPVPPAARGAVRRP